MSARKREVRDWLASHEGAVTRAWLLRLGYSPAGIQQMLESEVLMARGPGRYRSGAWPDDDRRQLLSAICQQNSNVVVSHTTAGKEWGYRRMSDHRVHVLCPHGCSPSLPGIVVHRCRRIDPVDIVERDDGVRLASPPRALFDASSIIGHRNTISVVEQVLDTRMCTLGTLRDTTERLFHPRRPGSLEMRRALASRPPWRAAMQSDLEVEFFLAMARAGLPEPIPQHAIDLDDGTVIHVDFGWPEFRVAVEVDCPFWHSALDEVLRDKQRDLGAAAVGWETARVIMPAPPARLADDVTRIGRVLELRGWAA